MTICPVAIAVGCKSCPVFRLCLVKGVLGDFERSVPPAGSEPSVVAPATKPRVPAKRTRQRAQPAVAKD